MGIIPAAPAAGAAVPSPVVPGERLVHRPVLPVNEPMDAELSCDGLSHELINADAFGCGHPTALAFIRDHLLRQVLVCRTRPALRRILQKRLAVIDGLPHLDGARYPAPKYPYLPLECL